MIGIRPSISRPVANGEERKRIDELEERLERHVIVLSREIGERNLLRPDNLKNAADYVREFWQGIGYDVTAQRYTVGGFECENLSAEVPGAEREEEIVIVGAHYDSVQGSPGANDNASAIASLLEISRLFNREPRKRTIRFVAFTNEEAPYFQTEWRGSRIYARMCVEKKERIVSMIALETMGFYSDQPGSQTYPLPLSLFYPDTGNFAAVVGNVRSRALVKAFTKYFMEGVDFPVECIAAFSSIPGISWSDHSSFWEENIPAIMVTDTAFYRYPFYHTHLDTPDRIRYPCLARVTYGCFQALITLTEK
ncbi:MAG: M28 family peptidase [Deltaproteobacteria bacterium]|nr:M28 family peptidase [Deltaproteobacteria bacterium]